MFQALLDSFLHLAYPALCLHCEEPAELANPLFCSSCVSLVHLLEISGRCSQCFAEIGGEKISRCRQCSRHPTVWRGAASAFDYYGPAATLVKRLKYGGQPYLALSAAAFLVAQWDKLGWPLPDVIVPVPMHWLRRLSRGYNQSELIATEMGKMLGVPVKKALKKNGGGYSQAGLSESQRQALSPRRFVYKENSAIADKTVLLIDDVWTTGSTLRCCAEALIAGLPRDLYALTLCRATLER